MVRVDSSPIYEQVVLIILQVKYWLVYFCILRGFLPPTAVTIVLQYHYDRATASTMIAMIATINTACNK